ncbi:putative T7SS-secreted protein [Amycolatopsis jiangsuensis]|uniref:Putative T7SS secretion signal domain-containing protein n=1 Tax=Amycolatopsis jiangsuensis TaxID=1181879 RepID=A0A840IVV6_9PSEU|nr:hypothetical protein [Amycolatopsis jiangsuensis]MBB4685342.1 hypothetical protein [Amycolatopsis jiangsuensis]
MAAELGETTDPKELVPGEPQLISGDLKQLAGTIRKMAGISDELSGIDAEQWTGAAADEFRQAFGAEPKKWLDAIGSLGQGAAALADYGDALTKSQSDAQRAIELYTQGQAATRAATAQWNARLVQSLATGGPWPSFTDPGQAATRQAEQILAAARRTVEETGDEVAKKLGFTKDSDGTFTKDLGSREFSKGKSWNAEWGTEQSDGMLVDKWGGVLEKLGIDTSEDTVSASADVSLLDGSLDGKFGDGTFGGSGKIEGAVLGAGAGAHAGASNLGVNAGAYAEAYLAKGSAEGELHYGDHVSVKGDVSGEIGAKASAEGTAGWTGVQGKAEAFAGGKIEGNASAEVAGVTAGVHGEAWAGVGAEASGQLGMGDDGKFHIGASLGVAVGIGGKVGFDIAIDPAEVVDTVQDVAGDVADVASDVGNGIADAAGAVGDFLGF